MFTGIIESLGTITNIENKQKNIQLTIKCNFANELKVKQSVAHNGVCLTVEKVYKDEYTVTAIKETLDKTNIGNLKKSDLINLERGMRLSERLDGHIVQGHVDQVGVCTHIKKETGSTIFTFAYKLPNITVEKGSVTINGISLTVVNSKKNEFSVAIVPYTLENTTFKNIKIGDSVNIEFDIIGKYISRLIDSKTK